MKHIHILGICGTFMGSLAQLAVEQGYRVTGCDANVYPPMSTQLELAGIELIQGYALTQLDLVPDVFIIGNAMTRGNPLVEAILDRGLPYTSGPQWLSENVLQGKWVLAVAGTHGKTTTSSMLAWVLEYAGMSPGYLIGGVPTNFSTSARLGETPFFVIEADEYDSAFFDKRSKFVHYHPRTLIINNLEFDHADIFHDLKAIQTQFHHLIRTVPNNGLIVRPEVHQAIDQVIDAGIWTPLTTFSPQGGSAWTAELIKEDGSQFSVFYQKQEQAIIRWSQLGKHNVANALATIAAAKHVGVVPEIAAEALNHFAGVKRRMECLYNDKGVSVYDDFAHHPTAISTTLDGLRAKVGDEKIVVLIEPRSNTMRMGVHTVALPRAFDAADHVLWYNSADLQWDIASVIEHAGVSSSVCESIDAIVCQIEALVAFASSREPVHIVIMSNGGFGGVHSLLIKRLKKNSAKTLRS